MKRHTPSAILIGVLLIATLLPAGCGKPSVDQDAQRCAALSCQALRLSKRAAAGDKAALNESQRLAQQAEALGQQLRAKYKQMSPQQLKAFIAALGKYLQQCQ